jgi:pseudouridine kinase
MPHGTQEFRQLAPFRARLVDATGAGDAMLAGYVAGLVHGCDVVAAADYGRAAAAITVESADTVSPSMTFASVLERVAEYQRSGTR